MLLIDEHIRADGALVRTHLDRDGDHVVITSDDGVHGRLSLGALDRVLQRYGKPLEAGVELVGDALDFGDGHVLRHLRWKAPVDAAPRDWLVWAAPGVEPVAALANGVAAALRYLVLRLSEEHAAASGTGGGDPAT